MISLGLPPLAKAAGNDEQPVAKHRNVPNLRRNFCKKGIGNASAPLCWPARVRGSVVECGSLHRFSRRSVFEASPDASAVASWQLDGAVETRRLFRVKLQVKPIDFLIRSH
jgi:hypothetical protein